MKPAAIALAVSGAVLVAIASVWLAFGFSPNNPRYDTAPLRNRGLQNFIQDEQRVLALYVLAAVVQLVGLILAILA